MDEVDLAIIGERNRDVQALNRDMEELADVFQVIVYPFLRDLADLTRSLRTSTTW